MLYLNHQLGKGKLIMTKRKTDEEFKQEVFSLVKDEFTFLDNYVNNKTKLRVKHNKCGNTYEVYPNNFLRGHGCPYCSGNHKKNDIQFQHEINFLVGNEYTFLDKYVNAMTKLRVKHNKCGNIYEVTPSKFLSGRRCPYCAGFIKKTDTQFQQTISSLVGDEYTFLDKYINSTKKLRVKHNKCGNVYEVAPNNFLQGNRCPYCFGTTKKTDIQFQHEVHILVGNEYTFLDKYVNNKTKLRVKHNKCGNTYEVKPTNFLFGKRCPYCSTKDKSKTDIQFQHEINFLVGNEYTFLDKYVNNHTKLRVKHNKCGNIYEVTPNSFTQGNRCPYCNNIPKGETIITKLLDTFNTNYRYQKTFPDLKDDRLLSYDFYIPDQNILIEYQGIQHYQPVDIFGGETTFKKQQKHDQMKLDYARDHGYNLIAVPYTADTFSKIKKYLIKHGLKK